MRVKLTFLPPFASAKFILPVPEPIKTVHDLKKHILDSLSVVSQHASKAKELVLEIDGFELLAGSEVDVIESGDVVSVRLAPGSSKIKVNEVLSKKRKSRDTGKDEHQSKKIRKTSTPKSSQPVVPQPTQIPTFSSITPVSQAQATTKTASAKRARSFSSSSSSSSDSPSLDSSSSSASSSSLTSSSSSSSSSLSSSSPEPESFPVLSKPSQKDHGAPPGQGKNSTKNRNARRRLAKQYKKKLTSQRPPANKDEQNGRTSESVVEAVTASVIAGEQQIPVPASMSNRNKKRGFLSDMKDRRGTKTLFGENNDNEQEPVLKESTRGIEDVSNQVDGNGQAVLPFQDTSIIEEIPDKGQREQMLVPSQMTDLPNNLFVTSAEFPRAPTSPRGRQRRKALPEELPLYDGVNGEEQEKADDIEEEVIGEEETMNSGTAKEAIWERVEAEFEALPPLSLESVGTLKVGDMVACKELELDMITYSPALVTKIAKVVEVIDGQVKLEWLRKPVVGYAEEGYADEGNAFAIDEPMDGGNEEVILDIGEVMAEKWKLLL